MLVMRFFRNDGVKFPLKNASTTTISDREGKKFSYTKSVFW
ncbi:hypothetical protein ACTV26_000822 [Campylobacter fetus]